MTQKQHVASFSKKAFLFIFLILGGYLGNRYSLALGFNIHFIFGSIFGLLATLLLGTGWAVAVTLIASSYTIVLWNHPYAICIFLAEILWVSICFRRRGANIIFSDTVFWCLLGIPLVFLFYAGVMKLGVQFTLVVAMKQAVNGVFNALVASVVMTHLHLFPYFRSISVPYQTSFANILFQFAALFLIVPSLTVMSFDNYRQIEFAQKEQVEFVTQEADKLEKALTRWLQDHINAARVIAELGRHYPLAPSPALQTELARIHSLFPDFHNVFLGDPTSKTIAFDPPVNERGLSTIGMEFSDREWFKALVKTKAPVVSDVFMGRGGIFQPIFSISVPLIQDGEILCFGLGATNLDQLKQFLTHQTSMRLSLIDKNNNVILSNTETRPSLQKIGDFSQSNLFPTSSTEVFIQVPNKQANISAMASWKNAFFVLKRPIPGTFWVLLVESPIDPLQHRLYDSSIQSFSVVAGLFLIALGLAVLLSRILEKTPKKLMQISNDLPVKIEKGDSISWPTTTIKEMSHLISNFRETADDLGSRIRYIANNNVILEQIVENRTEELQKNKQRLADILEAAPVALGWSNSSGQIEYLNKKFMTTTGYDLNDIPTVDQWVTKAYPDPEYRAHLNDEWGKELKRTSKDKSVFNPLEATVTCKDGSLRDMVIEGTWVQDRLLVFFSDITERKRLREELEHQATTDELTGLMNRRQFFNVLKMELSRAQRFNHSISIAMVDIDHFKTINDNYGHLVGDETLKTFTRICKETVRETDILARLGGDEFIMLFPETNQKEALEVSERVRLAVMRHPFLLSGNPATITISVGIAHLTDSQKSEIEFMAHADQALYHAKNSGRNRVFCL